jgi:hypothetical protein
MTTPIHYKTIWSLYLLDDLVNPIWVHEAIRGVDQNLISIRIPHTLNLEVAKSYKLVTTFVADTGITSTSEIIFVPTIGPSIYGQSVQQHAFSMDNLTYQSYTDFTNTARNPLFIMSLLQTTIVGVVIAPKEIFWEIRTLSNGLVISGTTTDVYNTQTRTIEALEHITFNPNIHRPCVNIDTMLESNADYKFRYNLQLNDLAVSTGWIEKTFKTGRLLPPDITINNHAITPQIDISTFIASVYGRPDIWLKTKWIIKNLTADVVLVDREVNVTGTQTPSHSYIASISPTRLILKNLNVTHQYVVEVFYTGSHYGVGSVATKTFTLQAPILDKPVITSISSITELTPTLTASRYLSEPVEDVKEALWIVENINSNTVVVNRVITGNSCHICPITSGILVDDASYRAKVQYTGRSGAVTEWSEWYEWSIASIPEATIWGYVMDANTGTLFTDGTVYLKDAITELEISTSIGHDGRYDFFNLADTFGDHGFRTYTVRHQRIGFATNTKTVILTLSNPSSQQNLAMQPS